MADEDLDEETRAGFLATTREQVDRLTKLAADLLDLSRMDAGRLRVEQEEVVLADAARALVDELTPLAEATGHRLVLETDPDALGARRRGARPPDRPLRSRATRSRTRPRARRSSSPRPCARVGRSSRSPTTGRGSRASTRERIFDRFYRVEGPHASGSGLGLAIARELAERMGGTVELSGATERTTFTLSLPAAAVAAGELAVST